MKSISVREMKAQWAEVERQVQQGETFEVLNRGKPAARIIPAGPRRVFAWEDHLSTAITAPGRSGSEAVHTDREGRW